MTPDKSKQGIEDIIVRSNFYERAEGSYKDYRLMSEEVTLLANAIKEYYLGLMPNNLTPDIARMPISAFQKGYNTAIQEMRERMK